MKHKSLRYTGFLLLFPAAAVLQYYCSNHPEVTEKVYSRGIYPILSAIISTIFGIFPFSVAELLFAFLLLGFICHLVSGIFHLPKIGFSGVLGGLYRLVSAVSLLFFLFVALWGLNYCRQPLVTTMQLKTGAPSKEELSSVLNQEIDETNALCPQISYSNAGCSQYSGGFTAIASQVNQSYGRFTSSDGPSDLFLSRAVAHPKSIYPSSYFSDTGLEGIFIPFTYEPSVDTDYPDFILPFTTAHETAHFKGFAREDEASFLAYLSLCKSPDVYMRYSAHLNAILYISNTLNQTDAGLCKQGMAKLDGRAASDIQAYNSYIGKHRSRLQNTAEKINDIYLKVNGERNGIVSYDGFVNLLCDEYRTDNAV